MGWDVALDAAVEAVGAVVAEGAVFLTWRRMPRKTWIGGVVAAVI